MFQFFNDDAEIFETLKIEAFIENWGLKIENYCTPSSAGPAFLIF
jgi:hypothetical protein